MAVLPRLSHTFARFGGTNQSSDSSYSAWGLSLRLRRHVISSRSVSYLHVICWAAVRGCSGPATR
jgi:hypothetical protein